MDYAVHPDDEMSVDITHEGVSGEEFLEMVDANVRNLMMVNHPPHYTAYPGVEVIQLTEHMNFCRGNVVKYVARAGLKESSDELEDLKKAMWYLQREIERLETAQS